LFIVCSLIAKRTLALLRAVSANSSPASLKRVGNKVVFQTKRTLFVTSAKIDFTILIYALNLILLVLITSFIFLYYQAGRVFLAYYVSILYKINRNTQVVIVFFSKKTKRLFFIRARLRIY
jgi:hypothetical protein